MTEVVIVEFAAHFFSSPLPYTNFRLNGLWRITFRFYCLWVNGFFAYMVNFSSDKRGPYIRNPVQLDTLSKFIYAGTATVSVIYDLLAKQAFAFVLCLTHLSYSYCLTAHDNTCLYLVH